MLDPTSFLTLAATRLLDHAARRLTRARAERSVAQGAAIPNLLEDNLKTTLQRLRTGGLAEPLWRQLITPLMSPAAPLPRLEDSAVREWLSDARVGEDLIALAKAETLRRPLHDSHVRRKLAESYRKYTSNDQKSATEDIDLAVSVLVAGFLASIPPEHQPTAALILGLSEQTYIREIDPITRAAHTKIATEDLQSILSTHDFVHAHPQKKIQDLLMRVTKGELSATDAETTEKIRYWTARLCASTPKTLDVARALRGDLPTDDPALDLTIVDALIHETTGEPDLALRALRDPHSPDQRAALFATLVRVRGHEAALDWFGREDHTTGVEFFTAHGWRIWGTAMALSGKWSDAAAYLSRFENSWPEAPSLALIEGVINAAMLLPEYYRPRALHSVPWYHGICLDRTNDVASYHARAVQCFHAVRDHHICQDHREFREQIPTWLTWLDLMSPDPRREISAQESVANRLNAGNHEAVSLAPLAWAFDIPYDSAALTEWLRHRQEIGGLSPSERLAECLVNLRSMSPNDFVDYLESRRPELEEALPPDIHALMMVHGLIEGGQNERAEAWLERSRHVLGEALSARAALLIKGWQAADQRQTLETHYRQTESLPDLRALLAHLEVSDDRDALLPYLRTLFEKERTVKNAVRLVSRSDSVAARLLFLEENSDLVVLSEDLQAMKAGALFAAGRFEEAQILNQALLKARTDWRNIHLACHIAISTGNWEFLPGLVEQEWKHRDSLDAEQLIQLAYFASENEGAHHRALQFARLATEKAPEEPDILTATYVLHTHLGRDSEVDPGWLKKAADQSSQVSGPVWTMSPRSIVEELLPRRRARLQRTEQHLVAGEIPFSVAVEQRNTALSSVFLHASKHNATLMDGRNRGVLPIIAANKGDVDIGSDWTVGLDLTSVLVLEYLDLLRPTLDSLHKVALSADIFEWLFIERRTVRFQQPTLVQEAKNLIEHHRSGKIQPIVVSQPISDQVSNEVGTELAALLAEAQDTAGVVVCTRPIYRPDSMMEEEATIDDFEKSLVSPQDLFALLHQKGHITLADHTRAQQFRSALHGRPSPGIPASALDQPIYVDRLALGQIQRAELLQALTSAVPDLRIHPAVLAEAQGLAAESDVGSTLAARIDKIRTALREAIQAGKAFQLRRNPDDRTPRRTGHHAFDSTTSLLGGAGSCDAVCIDDRSLNRHGGFLESTGEHKPIASVLDVLRALRDRQTITADEYWSSRHRLRRGGFAFVLPERDELLYWLKRATIKGDQLIEGEELQTIRQDGARTAIRQIATAQEAVVLESRKVATMAHAILDIWTGQ